MADDDADRRAARIVIGRGKQDLGRAFALCQPVGFRAGRDTLGALDFGLDIDRCGRRLRLDQLGVEIGNHQAAAVAHDKAADCAARGTRPAAAQHELAAFGQGLRGDLHDMRARDQAVEMIAAVPVGDRKAAIFEHDAHARDAAMAIRQTAAAICDLTRQCHPARQAVFVDPHNGVGRRGGAGDVGDCRGIFGAIGAGLRAYGRSIGDLARPTAGQIAQWNCQQRTVGRKHGIGSRHAIDLHRTSAQAQQRRRLVGQYQPAHGVGGIAVGHSDGIGDQVAGLRFADRGDFGDLCRSDRTIDRNVDLHLFGGGDDKWRAIRSRRDHNRLATGAGQTGELRSGQFRWCGVRRRWNDNKTIAAECDFRKTVLPWLQDMRNP